MNALILRKPEVIAYTGVPASSLTRLVSTGQFPKPIRLSARAIGWLRSDLDAWIEARVAQRDNQRAAA